MAKTLRSVKSSPSFVQDPSIGCLIFQDCSHIEHIVDFSEVIASAVLKYGCSVSVVVDNIPDVYQEIMRGKGKIETNRVPMVKTIIESKEPTDQSTLVISASHDPQNRLVEIGMNRYRFCIIPRILMHILRHILPKYTKLNKFKINDSSIDKFTIYEFSSILVGTTISDVCLDSTFLPEGNYDILLNKATSLRHLSLARCKINDTVCKRIFSKLEFSQPAGKSLSTLNLSSNRITDLSAIFIGHILRKNRHLRYLNLADNRITDDGAGCIFDALKEFSLNSVEVGDKKAHYFKYLQNKHAMYKRYLQDFERASTATTHLESVHKKPTKKKKASMSQGSEKLSIIMDEFNSTKAELLALELLGPFEHPFDKAHTVTEDGNTHCSGNLALSYLNFAYNNLMYPSLKKLLAVLKSQQEHARITVGSYGLLKVVLVGNNLPEHCGELDAISEILSGRIKRSYAGTRTSTQVKRQDKKSLVKSTL